MSDDRQPIAGLPVLHSKHDAVQDMEFMSQITGVRHCIVAAVNYRFNEYQVCTVEDAHKNQKTPLIIIDGDRSCL